MKQDITVGKAPWLLRWGGSKEEKTKLTVHEDMLHNSSQIF